MAKASKKKTAKASARADKVNPEQVMKKIVTVLQAQLSGKTTAEVALACGWPADAVVAVAYLNTEMGKIRKAANDAAIGAVPEAVAVPGELAAPE